MLRKRLQDTHSPTSGCRGSSLSYYETKESLHYAPGLSIWKHMVPIHWCWSSVASAEKTTLLLQPFMNASRTVILATSATTPERPDRSTMLWSMQQSRQSMLFDATDGVIHGTMLDTSLLQRRLCQSRKCRHESQREI